MDSGYWTAFNCIARSDGKGEGSSLESSTQLYRQQRTPASRQAQVLDARVVGPELPEVSCVVTLSSRDCLKLRPEQPRQLYKVTAQPPTDFESFPALLSNQLLGHRPARTAGSATPPSKALHTNHWILLPVDSQVRCTPVGLPLQKSKWILLSARWWSHLWNSSLGLRALQGMRMWTWHEINSILMVRVFSLTA